MSPADRLAKRERIRHNRLVRARNKQTS